MSPTSRGEDREASAGAFVRLLTQNERHVYSFILSMVTNWADAEEILQETNVRLWNEFDQFVPGSNFAAWACTVARFQVLTFRKRRDRERVRFTDEFIDVVAEEMTPDDDAVVRHRALEACVQKLSGLQRDMLRAYYEPGAEARKVAERFGRNLDALYKTLSRLRRSLHECIERELNARVLP